MNSTFEYPELAPLVEKAKTHDKSIYLIGVAGIPGSGKTTLCSQYLQKVIPNSVVLPMDGYHLYRKDLDENGHRYRGAPFTFDSKKFKDDLLALKKNGKGSFPSFDHAVKDPVENDIVVGEGVKCVIVEGLYLFLEDWGLGGLFDAEVFIDCDVDQAIERVAKRHVECGISNSLEEAIVRANDNDRKNALHILEKSILRADVYRVCSSK